MRKARAYVPTAWCRTAAAATRPAPLGRSGAIGQRGLCRSKTAWMPVISLKSLPGKQSFRLDNEPSLMHFEPSMDSAGGVTLEDRSVISQSKWLWESPSQPKTILMVKKTRSEEATSKLAEVAEWIQSRYPATRLLVEPGAARELPHLDSYEEEDIPHLERVVDFIISLGGDGTLLHVSSLFKNAVPPILPFSMGSLGFLIPFEVENFRQTVKQVMQGGFSFVPRVRLSCSVVSEDSNESQPQVINEIALRTTSGNLASINCFVNDQPLFHCSSDGFVVATSTGSTAYNLSCGGSIVHPAVPAVLLTPICSRSLSLRSAVLPMGVNIKLELDRESRAKGLACWLDGKMTFPVRRGDYITVSVSKYCMPTVTHEDAISDWAKQLSSLGFSTHRFPF